MAGIPVIAIRGSSYPFSDTHAPLAIEAGRTTAALQVSTRADAFLRLLAQEPILLKRFRLERKERPR
jgi:hypothetical protein